MKKVQKLFKEKSLFDVLAIAVCIAFIFTGSLVSLHRFWQYEESFIDFGQYDRSIWQVSRFQAPIVHHFIYGDIVVFGDHVTPSIFLISPLYWLTDRSEMLLIVQALVVGLSGYILYLIGKIVLKDRLFSISILFCYFLFVGLQNAVITEFHELTVMTLPLMLTFWAIVKEKKWFFFFFLILTLGFKEITFSLGISIGIAIFLLNKKWRKISLITILISIFWGLLAFKIIIPYFNSHGYLYASSIPDSFFGKVSAFFDDPLKRRTLFFSFFSFSFLPFLAPQFWLSMLQDYASRFLPYNFITRWDLGMHYNAQSAVLLAVSSIFAIKRLSAIHVLNKNRVYIGLFLIINSLILFRFILNGPFLLAINPAFYRHSGDFDFLNKMIKQIPKNVSVMTQNNLAVRLTHQDVRLLQENYEDFGPEYILVDNRSGQNPNDFFGSTKITPFLAEIRQDRKYQIIYRTQDQYIFKRKK